MNVTKSGPEKKLRRMISIDLSKFFVRKWRHLRPQHVFRQGANGEGPLIKLWPSKNIGKHFDSRRLRYKVIDRLPQPIRQKKILKTYLCHG